MVTEYEYRGLLARSWDFLRGDTSTFPDRQFFRDVIQESGEPALIVGCGTGRLLLECRADGMHVEGLDISPEMLQICAQKAAAQGLEVTCYIQSMETMDLPQKYRTIIVPSSSFQLLPDIDGARAALERFFQHLEPGGTLAMSIWHIQGDSNLDWSDWRLIAEKDNFQDGMGIRRWERSWYDARSQLRHTENRYELLEDGKVVSSEIHRRSPELRDYRLEQLSLMFTQAGFGELRSFSGFSSQAASAEDEVYCMLGHKP